MPISAWRLGFVFAVGSSHWNATCQTPSEVDQMPDVYIIGFNGSNNDDAVMMGVNSLLDQFKDQANVTVDVTFTHSAEDWPGAVDGSNVYLVAHGSAFGMDGNRDPANMLRENPNIDPIVKRSGKVVLMACSTGGVPVKDDIFAVKSFAENLRDAISRPVEAAVGPVDAESLTVAYTLDGSTAGSKDGWFHFDENGTSEGNPFEFEPG
jgi:hypothetical protein